MTEALFRALLNAILAAFHRRLDSVLNLQALTDDKDSLADALLDLVEESRSQAWGATVMYMRAEVKALDPSAEPWVPEEPDYDIRAVRAAIREAPGSLSQDSAKQQLRNVLDRHIEASARQTVNAAVVDAPDVTETEPIDPKEASQGFPEDVAEQMEREIRREQNRKRRRQAWESAFDDVVDRVGKAIEETSKIPDAPQWQGEHSLLQLPEVADVFQRDKEGHRILRPFAWARVVHESKGGPCGFCVMLASRGPVYASSISAGLRADRFHNNCRCTVVPVYTSRTWPGKEDHERYAALYQSVVRDGGLHGAQARTGMDLAVRGNRSAEKSAARERRRRSDNG